MFKYNLVYDSLDKWTKSTEKLSDTASELLAASDYTIY